MNTFHRLSSLVRMDRTLHTGGCDFTDLLCVSGDVRRSSLVLALWTCRAISCFAHTIGSFIFTSSIFSLVLLADWWDTPYLDSDHDRPRNASRRVSRFTTLGSINCSPQFMVALGTCGCWLFLFLRSWDNTLSRRPNTSRIPEYYSSWALRALKIAQVVLMGLVRFKLDWVFLEGFTPIGMASRLVMHFLRMHT